MIYVYLQGVSYMTEWADLDQKTLNQSIIFCIFFIYVIIGKTFDIVRF